MNDMFFFGGGRFEAESIWCLAGCAVEPEHIRRCILEYCKGCAGVCVLWNRFVLVTVSCRWNLVAELAKKPSACEALRFSRAFLV